MDDGVGVKGPATNQEYLNAEKGIEVGVEFTPGLQLRIDEQVREGDRGRRAEQRRNREPGLFQKGGFFDRQGAL